MGTQTLVKVDNAKSIESRDEIYNLVGDYISAYKVLNKVSDSYIARHVGCTKQAIQSLRAGNGSFSSSLFIAKVSAVFGLSLVDLLFEARKLRESATQTGAEQST